MEARIVTVERWPQFSNFGYKLRPSGWWRGAPKAPLHGSG